MSNPNVNSPSSSHPSPVVTASSEPLLPSVPPTIPTEDTGMDLDMDLDPTLPPRDQESKEDSTLDSISREPSAPTGTPLRIPYAPPPADSGSKYPPVQPSPSGVTKDTMLLLYRKLQSIEAELTAANARNTELMARQLYLESGQRNHTNQSSTETSADSLPGGRTRAGNSTPGWQPIGKNHVALILLLSSILPLPALNFDPALVLHPRRVSHAPRLIPNRSK